MSETEPPLPPNIYDLAREVGVSYATVSRALNGRRDVSAATRDRVLAAASRLGYSPNPIARGLARFETSSVGLVVPGAFDPFSVDFARGVQDEAGKAGYAVMTWFATDSLSSVSDALRHFARFRMDGVVVLGGTSEHDRSFSEHYAGPIVTALRRTSSAAYSAVWVDHRQGAAEMVRHLSATGRRRIAFVSLPIGSDASKERLEGYRDGMLSLGRSGQARVQFAEGTSYADGVRATEAILDADPVLPEAIFYASDVLAIGGLHALGVRGLQVPSQISVAGFGDIAAAEFALPALTTVTLSIETAGRLAMQGLLAKFDSGAMPASVEIPLRVLERASTGN